MHRYILAKPWDNESPRHLVRTLLERADDGHNVAETACDQRVTGWVGPVFPMYDRSADPAKLIGCEACKATEQFRALAEYRDEL